MNFESKESEKVLGSELSFICLHLSILTLFLTLVGHLE